MAKSYTIKCTGREHRGIIAGVATKGGAIVTAIQPEQGFSLRVDVPLKLRDNSEAIMLQNMLRNPQECGVEVTPKND